MKYRSFAAILFFSLLFAMMSCSSVSTETATVTNEAATATGPQIIPAAQAASLPDSAKASFVKAAIEPQKGGPAETVRDFYRAIKERRFHAAMMMTNLRAAVEGLTMEDMKELESEFNHLSGQVPEDLQVNGEQISGSKATVFLKMPNDITGAPELQEVQLRKEGEQWIILSAEDKEEADAKKQGKAYFFNLRIMVKEAEAQNMLERIYKAQSLFSATTNGLFGSMDVLISQGFLPVDVSGTESTGYAYRIMVSDDRKRYVVNAVPAAYGKTGKLSFYMDVNGKDGQPNIKKGDNKGLPLKR